MIGGIRARIFDALWRARFGGGIETAERFMSMVYGGDANGGPETFNVISVHMVALRKVLAPTGYTITLNHGRPKRGWRLQKITA